MNNLSRLENTILDRIQKIKKKQKYYDEESEANPYIDEFLEGYAFCEVSIEQLNFVIEEIDKLKNESEEES